jgi:hypothetical protein
VQKALNLEALFKAQGGELESIFGPQRTNNLGRDVMFIAVRNGISSITNSPSDRG